MTPSWLTQPPSWLTDMRAMVAQRREALVKLEAALAACEQALEVTGAPLYVEDDAPPVRRGRRPKADSNAATKVKTDLEAEVLAVLDKARKPLKSKEVCDRIAGAGDHVVVAALRALVAKKAILKTGATISLRYCHPAHVPADAE